MADFYYDDKRLMALFEALDEKTRRKTLRSAMQGAARALRKDAVGNLRASGLKSNKYVEQGVRAVAYKKVLGFKVTVGSKKRRVNYSGLDAAGRKAKAKQEFERVTIARWAEGGTSERRTTRTRRLLGLKIVSKGRGRRTGRMPAFRFMEKTKATSAPKMEAAAKQMIVDYVEKNAKKYGATFS